MLRLSRILLALVLCALTALSCKDTILAIIEVFVVEIEGGGQVLVGATIRLTAVPKDDRGNRLTNRPVSWATSDASRATVDPTGLVRALFSGPVTITANIEGKSGAIQLTIIQPAPTVQTLAATMITPTGGRANGTVNPNGVAATATFEWGTTTSLGSQCSPILNIAAANTPQPIACDFSGVAPNTQIFYRVTATNSGGTSRGEILNFRTLFLPPTVTTRAATQITTSGGVANGDVNPNGLSTSANFEWGTTNALGNLCGASVDVGSGTTNQAVICTFTGASPGTTIFYRVVATNAAGTSRGSILSFTTLVNAPTVVTQAATNITSTGAVTNGTVNPNGAATTATTQFGSTMSLGSACVPTLDMGSGTAPLPISCDFRGTLAGGVTVFYRVTATNAGGTTNGTILNFTTLTAAPTVVTGGATGVTTSGGTANATVNPNGAATSVNFDWGTTPALGSLCSAMNWSIGSGSTPVDIGCIFSGFAPGTTIYYRARAVNTHGTVVGSTRSFMTLTSAADPVSGAGGGVSSPLEVDLDGAQRRDPLEGVTGVTVTMDRIDSPASATLIGTALRAAPVQQNDRTPTRGPTAVTSRVIRGALSIDDAAPAGRAWIDGFPLTRFAGPIDDTPVRAR